MNENILSTRIAALRRAAGYTQEQLAARLGVSFQAVSKWENAQSCPDIMLLPALADIFGVSIDSLFGRETLPPVTAARAPEQPAAAEEVPPIPVDAAGPEARQLPWPEDGGFYVVLFHGHELMFDQPLRPLDFRRSISFSWEGPVDNLTSAFNVNCDQVYGNVQAGGDVDCGDVLGHASAGRDLDCGGVAGNVSAGRDVDCGGVAGSVTAGGDVDCGTVGGSVKGNGMETCD